MTFTRRQAMRTITTGFGSLALAAMTTHETLANAPANPLAPKESHFPARAKHVIMLFMDGAPSHVDTFDYKPQLIKADGQAEGQVRRLMAPQWKFKQRGKSGLWISDLFPNVSRHADDLCLLRGMHCDQPNHPSAQQLAHTGSAQFVRPSLGAWSVYGLGSENANLPGFVVMREKNRAGKVNFGNSFLPACFQGTPVHTDIKTTSEKPNRKSKGGSSSSIPNISNATLAPSGQRTQLDLLKQLNKSTLQHKEHQPQIEGIMQSYELAFRMQSAMPSVVDLARESVATKAMYGIGESATNAFGTRCLLARRMVESGVRFIEVGVSGWDHHNNLKERLSASCSSVDKPIAGLLADLKQRDLLKDTLVVWAGEFGRTPHGTGNGRGHNNKGYTTWMAGGGVKGGFSYGATDDFGHKAVENQMHTHDWHATILHLLGLNHKKLTYRYAGRDFRLTNVAGKVAKDIIA